MQDEIGRNNEMTGKMDEALRLLIIAAESGDAAAQIQLGDACLEGDGAPKDLAQAFRWFESSAKQGHAEAQCRLGYMIVTGTGVPKNIRMARRWFRAAAKQGHSGAQLNLGMMYLSGEDIGQSDTSAETWFRKAARQGRKEAIYHLGMLHVQQRCKAPDTKKGLKLLTQAAEEGYPSAQYALAEILMAGDHAPRDPDTAQIWLAKAAEGGHAKAKSLLSGHDPHDAEMTPAEKKRQALEDENREFLLFIALLRQQLLDDGCHYIRWTLSGSGDQGGIIDLRSYDANENSAVLSIETYGKKKMTPLAHDLLRYGNRIMDQKMSGFGINDGGHGWIVWDLMNDQIRVRHEYNQPGLNACEFDTDYFNHIRVEAKSDWKESDPLEGAVSVTVHVDREVAPIEGRVDWARFMKITAVPGDRKKKRFFDSGGKISCSFSISDFFLYLQDMGTSHAERLYYIDGTRGVFSRSEDDFLQGDPDCQFILGQYDYFDVFFDGWQPAFEYCVKSDSEVIKAEFHPGEI